MDSRHAVPALLASTALLDSTATGPGSGSSVRYDTRTEPPPGPPRSAPDQRPTLLVGTGREERVLERIKGAKGGALVIAADVEAAARWAQRLAKLDRVVRLDSGGGEGARAQAWRRPAPGSARVPPRPRS